MSTSRRDFVKITGAATAGAVIGAPAAGFASDPALGLIFPPKDYPIPPDAKRLYPAGVEFLGDGVGLPGGMTVEGYEEAIPRVVPVAEALKKRGAKVISVFGSSLTFYKGAKFNQDSGRARHEGNGSPGDDAEQRSDRRPQDGECEACGGCHRVHRCGYRQTEAVPRGTRLRGDVGKRPRLRARPRGSRHAGNPVQPRR